MKTRTTGYKLLMVLTILLTISAIVTLIPNPGSDVNMMGYHSVCSGAPMSTLVLVIATGLNCFLRKKYFTA